MHAAITLYCCHRSSSGDGPKDGKIDPEQLDQLILTLMPIRNKLLLSAEQKGDGRI
jgi:hypothetical protein